MDLLVSAVVQEHVFTVSPSATLKELEAMFVEHRVSGFPVVENGELVGVVSNSDLIKALNPSFDISRLSDSAHLLGHAIADSVGQVESKLHVKDVMTKEVVTCSPKDHLHDVADLMYEKRIHRIFVTENDKVVGVLTPYDFVRLYATDRIKAGHTPVTRDF